MFNPNNPFDSFLVIPILNILIGFYHLFQILGVPGALGLSIILLTIITRLILHPLTATQLKSTYKLNKLKPELDKIQSHFKDDKQKMHQEQMKLYQQAGINPAAGCLPLLIQMPILIALYNLFRNILANGNLTQMVSEINKPGVLYFPFLKINSLDLSFFGLNLAYKPIDWQKFGWWLLLIPLITAALQYWQTKMMMPQSQKTDNLPAQVGQQQITEKNKEKKEEDMSAAMQKQMAIMMPLMIGYFAYTFPLGLSLYWNTFTVFAIIQQDYLNKKLNLEHEKNN